MSATGGNHTDWRDSFWRFFTLNNRQWTPPKAIRVRSTRRGMVLKAAFIMPDGNIARTSVMLRRRPDGQYVVCDEGLNIKLRLNSRARSQS